MTAPTTPRVSVPLDGEGRSPIYTAAYESIRKGAPGLSDVTCQSIARSINMKVPLAAAPVREEGGAVKVGDRVVVCDPMSPAWHGKTGVLEKIGKTNRPILSQPTTEAFVRLDDGARCGFEIAQLSPALATREEATAGAGEIDGAVERLAYAADFLEGDCVIVGDHEVRGNDLLAVLCALRAQPQAREEAQPVAWRWRQRSKGPDAHWSVGHTPVDTGDAGETARLFEVHPLYTTTPAPEAEKLRVAVEALTWSEKALERYADALGLDQTDEAAIRALQLCAEALAALQQDTLSAAPGEAK